MAFMDKKHREAVAELEKLWQGVQELSALGRSFGILDIFQDNGAKILQQLVYMNMKRLDSREGNDAIDENGLEWELKSANEELVSGFSTHHHLNFVILEKYRQVPWMFAFYSHTVLNEIYVMPPTALEPVFQIWQDHLSGKKKSRSGAIVPAVAHINNPKIPLTFVRTNGTKVWPFGKSPLNPADVVTRKKR